MRKLFILLGLIVISCNTENNKEKIILTTGISMNPDEPRIGIEINKDSLYYCEEINSKKGHYRYYKAKINSEVFFSLKQDIQNNFKEVFKDDEIADSTPYQLNIKFDSNSNNFKFYLNNLNSMQLKIIKRIKNVKGDKLVKIKDHDFPKELLLEKLPEPPLIPVK